MKGVTYIFLICIGVVLFEGTFQDDQREKRQIRFPGQDSSNFNVNVPRPNIPRPNVPRPNVPRPNVPRPNVPRPNVPRPNVPRPNVPGPNVGSSDNCKPIMKCAGKRNIASCTFPDGTPGATCTDATPNTDSIRLRTSSPPLISLRNLNTIGVRTGVTAGKRVFEEMKTHEREFIQKRAFLRVNTPARGHTKQFKLKQSTREDNDKALPVVRASQEIAKSLALNPNEARFGLPEIPLSGTEFEAYCPARPRCNPQAKYRSVTGECNNLFNPLYGKSNTPVRRVLPNTYDDGIFEPRKRAADGTPLTNSRVIANNVLLDVDVPDSDFTLSLMQWSQFIDHDLALSPFLEFINGEGIECCPDRRMPTEPVFEMCDPIPIGAADQFFSPRGQFCMNFIRSMLSINNNCTFGPAEQIEVLTHWIDGSNIYGSEEEDAELLREHRGGRLKVTPGNLLPFNPEGGECEAPLRGAKCFIAGESRVQEHVSLTAMHTIWHREHNRIANALSQMNPSWNDEQIFQEARRINVAQYTHIVYEEWMPIILGPENMAQLGLRGKDTGFSFDYDPSINPNTGNEFATAAFRFGHSLIVSAYHLIGANNQVNTIQLRDHFNTAHFIQQTPGAIDMFIRAFITQPVQSQDSFITSEVTNRLFQTPATDFGMDLMTINIERGRDHGIATYNDIREVCGLRRATDFRDLLDTIPADLVRRLTTVYKSVDDIDFFVGGIIEKPSGGGLLGRTFSCIIGDQFLRARRGDRFFYDLGNQAGSFNAVQLQEIRKASWARILCDNAENVPEIQPLAFRRPGGINQRVSCNGPAIPRINLLAFRGERPGST